VKPEYPEVTRLSISDVMATFDPRRQGQGQQDFKKLADATERSVIRFETRDAYDVSEADGFEVWRQTGDISANNWGDWGDFGDMVSETVSRGVRWRRVRIISRPPSEYMRWEHAITVKNVSCGEDIRWLWRDEAADLMVPAADCWVFDDRVIRWNFQRGDDSNPHVYTFSSDPRVARDIAVAFEMAWNRATPHADFDIDSDISTD
jgi:hypothetical protein